MATTKSTVKGLIAVETDGLQKRTLALNLATIAQTRDVSGLQKIASGATLSFTLSQFGITTLHFIWIKSTDDGTGNPRRVTIKENGVAMTGLSTEYLKSCADAPNTTALSITATGDAGDTVIEYAFSGV